ncbi:hypothetical protein ACMCNP_06110 [Candidatus Acidulodesulfobacterium sp. H_13]|uniref:hypothetical protein n=1 Tax=Candidatus Acidulodesulfobacterium sp. H_13 TaxID=3395470 RepID=UPI003AF99DC6
MKYIGQSKKSLTQSFKEKPLKFRLVFSELIIGLISILIIAGIIKFSFGVSNVFASIFLGFISAYFMLMDTAFYLFKHFKKLSILKINFIVIRDLLIVLLFFIISNRMFDINFVIAAIGITVVPFSLVIYSLISPSLDT